MSAYDNIIIRQASTSSTKGEKPGFKSIRLGREMVGSPIVFPSPLYIGKMPGIPALQKHKELAGRALARTSLYCPPGNHDLEGCFSIWSPLRSGLEHGGALHRCPGVEIWTSEISYHKDTPVVYDHLEGEGSMTPHVDLLREVTEYRVPIIIRLSGGDIYKHVMAAVEAGADGVILSVHDTLITSHPKGMLGLFPPAARAMHDSGAREKGVLLMVEGEIGSGADLYKALAMGADMVGTTTPAMNALESGAGKLDALLSSIEIECLSLMGLSGHSSQEKLSSDDLVAADYDTAMITGLKILGYEKELPIWLH